MGLLQSGELASMRAEAERAMSSSCNILSNAGAAITAGGGRSAAKANWQPIAGSPFKCRACRPRDFTIGVVEGGSAQALSKFRFALPFGTPVNSKHRIEIIGGSTYEVEGVDGDHSDAIQIIVDTHLVQ